MYLSHKYPACTIMILHKYPVVLQKGPCRYLIGLYFPHVHPEYNSHLLGCVCPLRLLRLWDAVALSSQTRCIIFLMLFVSVACSSTWRHAKRVYSCAELLNICWSPIMDNFQQTNCFLLDIARIPDSTWIVIGLRKQRSWRETTSVVTQRYINKLK